MKPVNWSALAGVLLILGFVPASQAVEILRWERLPLPVPLVVGQERVVFIDRNVRVGVPASVGDHLRVQSAGGAIYLRASEPIPPTRLQLQDVESGALILLDIAAEPAKDGQAPLEPVRIVEAEALAKRYGGGAASGADEQADAPADKPLLRRETPVPVVLTRHAAQSLYAPLRTVEPVAGIGRVNLRRGLALDTLLPTLPVRARALAAWPGRPVGDGRATHQHLGALARPRPARPAGTSWRRPSSIRTWGRSVPRPTPRCSTWSRAATAWPSRCCRR